MAEVFRANQVVVLGGGLSGVSAANTVIEFGGNACLLDKSAFCGGNSTKATSGINGANTSTQRDQKIEDTAEIFFGDIMKGGAKKPDIAKVLADKSGVGVQWLIDEFKLDLSLLARLGGHSMPRTHRGKERFPGMTITYALIQMLENIEKNAKGRAKIVCKARAHTLLQKEGAVIGVKYEKGGVDHQEMGPVIVCTGGFGADFTSDSLLAKHRPDLMHLPTTNGEHCTGDGLKMCMAAGGNTLDLEWVQVHPTGLVKLDEPDAKVKFLAAEALRGVGGLVFDREGRRFANELGRRDYVTGEMWKGKAPFRLALNEAAAKEIHWHCMHYTGRGVMKHYKSGAEFAKDMGIDVKVLEEEHDQHYEAAIKQEKDPEGGPYPAYPNGKTWDVPSGKTGVGKKFFHNIIPGSAVKTQEFFVAIITPVIHYCMGGVEIDEVGACVGANGKPIPGLYVAGEASGGVHGNNRLGGNALLECVVFGRQAGEACAEYIGLGKSRKETLHKLAGCYPGEETAAPTKPAAGTVAKKGKEKKKSSGKDATAEFNMVHPPGVVEKYLDASKVLGAVGDGDDEAEEGGEAVAAVPKGPPLHPAMMPDEEDWSCGGWIGAVWGVVLLFVLEILKTVIFIPNYLFFQKEGGDRTGLTRSAILLILFMVIHAVGNLHVFLGPDDFCGYGFFYVRLYWTGLGLEANIVEEYIALCAIMHVLVALKRTYQFKSFSMLLSPWKNWPALKLIISGMFLLVYMQIHLQQFRFAPTATYYLRPPKYGLDPAGINPFGDHFLNFFWTTDKSIPYVGVRDIYKLEVELFRDPLMCAFYLAGTFSFVYHCGSGWSKLVNSVMGIKPSRQLWAKIIGWEIAVFIGLLYASFVFYCYLKADYLLDYYYPQGISKKELPHPIPNFDHMDYPWRHYADEATR